jgi:transposase-like protein
LGPDYARKLKKRQGRFGDAWDLDEVFITIDSKDKKHRGVKPWLRVSDGKR